MLGRHLRGSLAALIAALPLSATAAPQTSPRAIRFYPPPALAAHTDGAVTLGCERTEHGALSECHLIDEMPSGQGFGAAALALAARSAAGCGPWLPPTSRVERPIRFTFSAAPASIEPDVLRLGWTLANPTWRHIPTGGEFSEFYPERTDGADTGEATVQCIAAPGGRLRACEVAREAPAGQGFGRAALKLSRFFQLDPSSCHGHSAGVVVIIPIRFQPAD